MKTLISLENPLFDTRFLALCIVDNTGRVIELNETFRRHFDYLNTIKPVGESIFSLPIWGGSTKNIRKAWQNLNNDGSVEFSQGVQLKDRCQMYHFNLRLFDSESGEVLVEIKQHEGELRQDASIVVSTEKRERMENMASIISHSLRAPAANIAYLLSVIDADSIKNDELLEVINAIKISSDQTLEALEKLGQMMNADLKEMGDDSATLRAMIDTVLEQFQIEIKRSKAQVEVNIEGQQEWDIPQEAFQMILGQIISNSLKFKSEQESPKIVITCLRQKGDRIIIVKDNGLGFDFAKNKHKVFGLFETFHDHRDARGVGLFQVKNRLLALGGEVSLQSQKGIGTSVTLNFKQNELEKTPLYN